ncbi:hypothetical protein [Pseudogulbenkiania ferrooxidans]|uniref:Phage protein n=1 Tax=Pseudogulbenkiania ferrooxidans 2002 TaxID=279714 RepID=B9Z301_9NEIS|nr:hypothetical protein [Pseudogulbenkiania ferrooxidans]EEG08954.1 conserved hypothetical protein [Pseudogulbenkiania ferrooxidans 2002]
MKTEPFELDYGVECQGVLHYQGEVRLNTLQDEIDLDQGEGFRKVDLMAKAIVRLGDIPAEELTEVLTGTFLASEIEPDDYIQIAEAQDRLKKKRRERRTANAATAPSA